MADEKIKPERMETKDMINHIEHLLDDEICAMFDECNAECPFFLYNGCGVNVLIDELRKRLGPKKPWKSTPKSKPKPRKKVWQEKP